MAPTMPTITVCLDSRLLTNPDADLRYTLPDLLQSRSDGILQYDGYGYSADNHFLIVYLETTDPAAGLACVLDVIKNTRVMGNDLGAAAIVSVEQDSQVKVVFPPNFQGKLPEEPNPLRNFWQPEPLETLPNLHRIRITADGSPLSFTHALSLWQTSETFRTFFIELLADSPFPAFRWETPSITKSSVDRPFEFVLHNAPHLTNTPDLHAFAGHFPAPSSGVSVISFRNLGNDATLIVPAPIAPHTAYAHLAIFLRQAPGPQKHALFQLIGQTARQLLSHSPLWISTAGMGVAWLHIRLDSRPKYYGYVPYTR